MWDNGVNILIRIYCKIVWNSFFYRFIEINRLFFHNSRKTTDVTNNMNHGSAVFRCPSKPWQWQRASMHNTRALKLKQLNGIQPSFILLFTSVIISAVTCQNIFSKKGQYVGTYPQVSVRGQTKRCWWTSRAGRSLERSAADKSVESTAVPPRHSSCPANHTGNDTQPQAEI